MSVTCLLLTSGIGSVAAQTSDEFFDTSTLQELRITMSSRDVQTLKANFTKNTHYPADLQWRGTRVRNLGVRSRGSGSRNATKLSLQLDFDHYSTTQKFLGMTSLVLDNLAQDPALIRERIAMQFFQLMGLPAPRESFCRLYVNGVYFGVYGVVEDITPSFLQRVFGAPDDYLYEYKYAGPFFGEYLGDELDPYKARFEPRSHELESDTVLYSPLRDLFREVNGPDDAVWRERVEAYVDLSELITYVATETFLSEADGILSPAGMSNFYLYRAPGTTLHRFIPWDKDRTFSDLGSSVIAGVDANVLLRRALAYPDLKALYLDRLAGCARSAANESWLDRAITESIAVIGDAAAEDTLKPYSNDDVISAIGYLRAFAESRSRTVLEEIARIRESGGH